MPIYEYQCEACGHKLEKIQKFTDAPLRDCPSCDEPRLGKLISPAGFRLKGGGWYETDFKSGSRRNVIDSDTGATGGGDTGEAGNNESKKNEAGTESVAAAAG